MPQFPEHIAQSFPQFCQRVNKANALPRLPTDFTFSKVYAYADCIPVLTLENEHMQSIPVSPEDYVWTWEVFLDEQQVYAWAMNKVYINRPPARINVR
jgi:hypothetical protein